MKKRSEKMKKGVDITEPYMVPFNQMEGGTMKIQLKKQPRKYLESIDGNTRKKLYKALDQLAMLTGDIRPLKGHPNLYRYKIAHYRIIFEWIKGDIIITVIEINTRTNIKY